MRDREPPTPVCREWPAVVAGVHTALPARWLQGVDPPGQRLAPERRPTLAQPEKSGRCSRSDPASAEFRLPSRRTAGQATQFPPRGQRVETSMLSYPTSFWLVPLSFTAASNRGPPAVTGAMAMVTICCTGVRHNVWISPASDWSEPGQGIDSIPVLPRAVRPTTRSREKVSRVRARIR